MMNEETALFFRASGIRQGDRVTIRMPAGFGRLGNEQMERVGTARTKGPAGWVLVMADGTSEVATPDNTVWVVLV